jgi:uncharacterized protein YjdB
MKNLKSLLAPSLAIAVLLGAGTLAKADPLPFTMTLDSSSQSGGAGQTLTFDVTITDTDADVSTINLDWDSINFGLPTTDFFGNTPFFLTPGQSWGDDELFSVFIPFGTATGVYSGTYDIFGDNNDGSDPYVVSSANFDVTVTPEPGTLLLLATGLLGLALTGRRRSSPKNNF